MSTDAFEAHLHQNSTHNGTNSFFSPEICSDTDSSFGQNKMATVSFFIQIEREQWDFIPFFLLRCNNFQYEVDHNQNYVTNVALQSDDENANPKYSDVISNNIHGKGSFEWY